MADLIDPEDRGPRMDAGMPDYSVPHGDDFDTLSRDRIPVRSITESDLDAVVRIDAKFTGRERRDYYEAKFREVMGETGVRVSLVAEVDGLIAGFIMARVDFGEFGKTEPTAVIDTIGVNPDHGHHGIASALLSQLLVNLDALHVDCVRTRVAWNDLGLIGFLAANGFAPAQQLVLRKPL